MNLSEIIWNLQAECESCVYSKALQVLRGLQDEDPPCRKVAVATATEPVIPADKSGRAEPENAPPPAPKPQQNRGRKPAPRVDAAIEKECKDCHTVKPLAEFEKASMCKDGHLGICKVCRNARRSGIGPALDKIDAEMKALKSAPGPGRYKCEPCHAVFSNKDTFDNHPCVARKKGSEGVTA